MTKKHIGTSVFDDIKRWEKETPGFREAVDDHIEKIKMAEMIKEIRQKENLSQLELAQKAHVTQSVIARIETNSARTLPRLDLFRRIIQSAGYELSIVAKKKGKGYVWRFHNAHFPNPINGFGRNYLLLKNMIYVLIE